MSGDIAQHSSEMKVVAREKTPRSLPLHDSLVILETAPFKCCLYVCLLRVTRCRGLRPCTSSSTG